MRRRDDYFEEIAAAMEPNYIHTRDWANFLIGSSGLNVAVFSSGVGDGLYESLWGLDANDEPACLVTDFGLLPEEIES